MTNSTFFHYEIGTALFYKGASTRGVNFGLVQAITVTIVQECATVTYKINDSWFVKVTDDKEVAESWLLQEGN